jgi:acetate kinase
LGKLLSAVVKKATVVLTVNSGSSSRKLAIIAVSDAGEERLATVSEPLDRLRASFAEACSALEKQAGVTIDVVSHRIVHGGANHARPVFVNDALLLDLCRIIPLAPLHLPASLAAIESIASHYPKLPQALCFDTGFHSTLPELARRLPIPERFSEVRKYGFHGLSYEYVMSVIGKAPPPKVIIAHLGNGASLAAISHGVCIDTTMGFTPAGGIFMGTRSGDLDPSVLWHLARTYALSEVNLERILSHESGLLAIGGTSDMKTLTDNITHDARARLAVDMFAYAVKKAIGGFTAVLGGCDLLVFTGGIGEHSPMVRALACEGQSAFVIDAPSNVEHGGKTGIVSAASSQTTVRVVETHEDIMLARHAARLMQAVRRGTSFGV